MTNYELYLKFIEIASHNPLDAYLELKNLRAEYKKSDFYKSTKLPLQTAYKLCVQGSLTQIAAKLSTFGDVDAISRRITDVINGIDEDAINNLVEKLMSVFDVSKLQEEKGDLKVLLNQFKDLVE